MVGLQQSPDGGCLIHPEGLDCLPVWGDCSVISPRPLAVRLELSHALMEVALSPLGFQRQKFNLGRGQSLAPVSLQPSRLRLDAVKKLSRNLLEQQLQTWLL